MDNDIFDASKLIAQKPWLDRALELAADTTIVFDYAKEEIVDDTKKARAKC